MRTLVATAFALLTAALLAPAVAGAQAPPPPIATVDGTTPVAAFHGRILWSVRSGATGNWTLVSRDPAGTIAPLPVPPRRVPFDADLGPGPDGGTVATYSRCATDPPVGSPGTLYNRGRGCDVWLFDFATGLERRVTTVSAPKASEFWPTVWGDRIAFARVYDGKRGLPYVYTRALDGGAASVRQPGGPRQACRRNPSNGRRECTNGTLSRPDHLDLWGRRLAFTWTFLAFAEGLDSEIRLDTIGGGHTRLARQGGGGLTQVSLGWPGFQAGRVYWYQSCTGDGSGCPGRYGFRRVRISTGTLEQVPGPPRSVISHDRDSGVTWLVIDGQPGADCLGDPPVAGGTCTIQPVAPRFG